VVPGADVFAKLLSETLPIVQIVWARFFVHTLCMVPVMLRRRHRRAFWPARPGLQVVRSLLLVAATFLFYGALSSMPIVDTLALFFISPLLSTLMSPLVLGERVGLRRRVAAGVGFLGVLIMLRPGFEAVEPAALMALGCGFAHSLYLLLTRRLAGTASAEVTLAWTGLAGALVLTVAVPATWVTPDAVGWLWMIGVGVAAVAGHFLLIRACDHAEASLLAPFGYAEIVTATIFGFLVFGDFPDPWTWTGIAVICASGIYIALRERRVDLSG